MQGLREAIEDAQGKHKLKRGVMSTDTQKDSVWSEGDMKVKDTTIQGKDQ